MTKKIFRELYENFEQYFCAIIVTAMVICLGAQVFFRYVLNASLTWSEELSRFTFVWIIYLGASMAARERTPIRVTAPQLLLPARYRRYATLFADLVWVVFNIFFGYQGVVQVKHMLKFTFISPALQWNTALIYSVIPAGFFLMSFRIIQGYWRDFRRAGFEAMGTDLFMSERTLKEEKP